MLQGCKRVIDACDGLFIGVDVKVADRVVDELESSVNSLSLNYDSKQSSTYSSRVLVEQHGVGGYRLSRWKVGCFGFVAAATATAPPHMLLLRKVTLCL